MVNMDIIFALVLGGLGLGLVIFFAEQLVKGVIGTSMGFGLSAFLLSVIFIGFDPDNLAVGVAASAEQVSGIAIGSIWVLRWSPLVLPSASPLWSLP